MGIVDDSGRYIDIDDLDIDESYGDSEEVKKAREVISRFVDDVCDGRIIVKYIDELMYAMAELMSLDNREWFIKYLRDKKREMEDRRRKIISRLVGRDVDE